MKTPFETIQAEIRNLVLKIEGSRQNIISGDLSDFGIIAEAKELEKRYVQLNALKTILNQIPS